MRELAKRSRGKHWYRDVVGQRYERPLLPFARDLDPAVLPRQGDSVQLTVTPISGDPWLLAGMSHQPQCSGVDNTSETAFLECSGWCVGLMGCVK